MRCFHHRPEQENQISQDLTVTGSTTKANFLKNQPLSAKETQLSMFCRCGGGAVGNTKGEGSKWLISRPRQCFLDSCSVNKDEDQCPLLASRSFGVCSPSDGPNAAKAGLAAPVQRPFRPRYQYVLGFEASFPILHSF